MFTDQEFFEYGKSRVAYYTGLQPTEYLQFLRDSICVLDRAVSAARTHPGEPDDKVAYVRVSTEDQADRGVSLAAQESRIAAYATALGLDVAEVVRDAGASAKTLDRPGMRRILEGVREGRIGRVAALKLDRITRST